MTPHSDLFSAIRFFAEMTVHDPILARRVSQLDRKVQAAARTPSTPHNEWKILYQEAIDEAGRLVPFVERLVDEQDLPARVAASLQTITAAAQQEISLSQINIDRRATTLQSDFAGMLDVIPTIRSEQETDEDVFYPDPQALDKVRQWWTERERAWCADVAQATQRLTDVAKKTLARAGWQGSVEAFADAPIAALSIPLFPRPLESRRPTVTWLDAMVHGWRAIGAGTGACMVLAGVVGGLRTHFLLAALALSSIVVLLTHPRRHRRALARVQRHAAEEITRKIQQIVDERIQKTAARLRNELQVHINSEVARIRDLLGRQPSGGFGGGVNSSRTNLDRLKNVWVPAMRKFLGVVTVGPWPSTPPPPLDNGDPRPSPVSTPNPPAETGPSKGGPLKPPSWNRKRS